MIKLAILALLALTISLLVACSSEPDIQVTPYDGGIPEGGCATDTGLCPTNNNDGG